MAEQYIIGIDGGSQSTKVIIFDTHGNVVAEGSEPLKPMLLPEEGVVLHPDDDLWDSLIMASKKALAAFPGKLSEIIGVGLCTIRCCRVLLKEDCTLAYPAISWMDLRLASPYQPDIPGVKYVTTTSGYITHRLTGEKKDTAANYEGEWPLDRSTWDWSEDPAVMKHYNIPREMLFDLVNPGTIVGRITRAAAEATGLPEGLPVAATANDKAVEALGTGSLEGNVALVSLGTYITSMIQGYDYISDAKYFWTNLASIPHRFIYESGGIRRGMSTVSWARELMGGDVVSEAAKRGLTPDDYLNEMAADIPAGCEGLMTVPEWLAPPSAQYKRGIILGFTGRHTGVHMYRSVMEAIALTMKNHCFKMCEERGKKLEKIIISGGGSNGRLFMQIFADVFGLPAHRNLVNGSVGLGSAICLAMGLGLYPDFESAMKVMIRPRDSFQPNEANTKFYDRMNEEVYKDITSSTDEILKKAHPVFA
ncbi:sugar kinase [Deltaproteobacteria bacterium Smac51]|nr:sugar kinase [Deltaproteobacteria bacterium Smac51]